MLWHVALLPITIYTLSKVDGSTLKRWISKGVMPSTFQVVYYPNMVDDPQIFG